MDPKGSVVRFEVAERFSKGQLVQHLYTATSDSTYSASDGLSIAVDSAGRVYTGNANASYGVLIDYDPNQSCPDLARSLLLPHNSYPQVTVDDQKRFYVTDYVDNTISAYTGGSTKLLKEITQEKGLVNLTYAAINP